MNIAWGRGDRLELKRGRGGELYRSVERRSRASPRSRAFTATTGTSVMCASVCSVWPSIFG